MRETTYGQSGRGRNAPPSRGFAEYITNKRGVASQPVEANTPARYAWPKMVIGRPINMAETGKPWSDFEKKNGDRYHRQGRMIPLKNWMLVYYSPDQMDDMMADRYEKITRAASDGERRRKAREVTLGINQAIGRLLSDKLLADSIRLDESPLLAQRIHDADNIELEAADWSAARDRNKMTSNIWLNGRFQVGRREGYGNFGLGIQLPDKDGQLAAEASILDDMLSSREFGFDVREAARHRRFAVQVVDTTPLPVAGMHEIPFAGYPLHLPLKSPHAFTS